MSGLSTIFFKISYIFILSNPTILLLLCFTYNIYSFLFFLRIHHERLEVEPNANSDMDFSKIVKDRKTVQDKVTKQEEKVNRITEPKEDSFVDDPDVPPLI